MGAELATTDLDQQQGVNAEQSEVVDQAVDSNVGVEDGSTTTEDTASDSTVETDDADNSVRLLSDEQIKEFDGDSRALEKALNKAATQKFQDLSEERKNLEPYSQFISALDKDPEGTVRALASRLGIDVQPGANEKAKEEASNFGDEMTQMVTTALGEDYPDLAEKLGPVMQQVAEKVAENASRPLLEGQERIVRESAEREARTSMSAFAEKHPDWQKHESAMVKLSKTLPPGSGVSDDTYLDQIYYLATRDQNEGEVVRKATERMSKSAKSGSKTTRVPDKIVARRTTGLPTFAESAEAARRGERFE